MDAELQAELDKILKALRLIYSEVKDNRSTNSQSYKPELWDGWAFKSHDGVWHVASWDATGANASPGDRETIKSRNGKVQIKFLKEKVHESIEDVGTMHIWSFTDKPNRKPEPEKIYDDLEEQDLPF